MLKKTWKTKRFVDTPFFCAFSFFKTQNAPFVCLLLCFECHFLVNLHGHWSEKKKNLVLGCAKFANKNGDHFFGPVLLPRNHYKNYAFRASRGKNHKNRYFKRWSADQKIRPWKHYKNWCLVGFILSFSDFVVPKIVFSVSAHPETLENCVFILHIQWHGFTVMLSWLRILHLVCFSLRLRVSRKALQNSVFGGGGDSFFGWNACKKRHFHRSSLLSGMIGDRALSHVGFGLSSASIRLYLCCCFLCLFFLRVMWGPKGPTSSNPFPLNFACLACFISLEGLGWGGAQRAPSHLTLPFFVDSIFFVWFVLECSGVRWGLNGPTLT